MPICFFGQNLIHVRSMPRLRIFSLLHGRPLGLAKPTTTLNSIRWSSTTDESPPAGSSEEPTTTATPSTSSTTSTTSTTSTPDPSTSTTPPKSKSKPPRNEAYPWSRTSSIPASKKSTPWLLEPSDIDLTSAPYTSSPLPLPPILTRPSLSIKHSHLHPKARLPPTSYSSRLYRNPYASMLATPIRTDSLEGARLPRFFLLQFGIRAHPLTQENWIVPLSIDPDEPEAPPGMRVGESAYLQCHMRYIQQFSTKGKQERMFTPEVRDAVGKMLWRKDMDVFVLKMLRKRALRELMNCRLGREEAGRVAAKLYPHRPASWAPVRWDKYKSEAEYAEEELEMEKREDEEVGRKIDEYEGLVSREEVEEAKRETRVKRDVELLWRAPGPEWRPVCTETYPMGPMFGNGLDEVKKVLGVKEGELSTVLKLFDRRNTEAIKWLYKLRMYIRQK